MRRLVLLLAAGAALAGASPAAAATFYASPTGGNAMWCPESHPCSLENALSQSGPNETIMLLAGNYTWESGGSPLVVAGARVLRGMAGSRPRIVVANATWVEARDSAQVVHVDIESNFTGLFLLHKARGQDLSVRGVQRGAAVNDTAILRDALVVATGVDAAALTNGTTGPDPGVVRNVTAVATGSGGVGFRATFASMPDEASGCAVTAEFNARIRNTILRGVAHDIQLTGDAGHCGGRTVDIDYSNFGRVSAVPSANIVAGSHNQTSAAQTDDSAIFADTTLYRQRDGAPTANAGEAAALDAVDLEGDPRTAEGAADIGADELPAPGAVSATTASALTPTSATVAATLSSSAGGDVRFEYGTTSAYGATTGPIAVAAGDAVGVQATLTGLAPSTTYHVRAVATGREHQPRTVRSADSTFTTPAAPVPLAPAVSPAALELVGALKAARSVRLAALRRRGLPVRFTLLRRAAYALRVTASLRVGGRRRTVVLAKRRAAGAAPGEVRATLRLTRAGRRALARVRRASATLHLVVTADGTSQTRTATVRLRR